MSEGSRTQGDKRKRIKPIEVMVCETIRETHDTTTLHFFTGNDRLEYKPGHFLTIDPHQFPVLESLCLYLEDIKGKKEPPRAYSLTSAPHERYLAITVKEEQYISGETPYPPLLSPLLVNRIGVGDRMTVTGFTGPYTMPDDIESRTDHLVHICAGSGSVPNYSILKYALATDMKLRHTFIYSNKRWDDIIFRDALLGLAAKYPDKVALHHFLTREEPLPLYGPNVRAGRVNLERLQEIIPDTDAAEFYVCGPAVSIWEKREAKKKGVEPTPRFLESVEKALKDLGIPRKKIHYESYG